MTLAIKYFNAYRRTALIKNISNLCIAVLIMQFSASIQALPDIPGGDFQGKVKAVHITHNAGKDYNAFQIWFEAGFTADRENCIANNGYVTVKSNGVGVDDTNFNMLYSLALTAKASEKPIALSAAGPTFCDAVNSGYIID